MSVMAGRHVVLLWCFQVGAVFLVDPGCHGVSVVVAMVGCHGVSVVDA
jgi:hypothetical protein